MCLPNALLLRGFRCELHILPTLLFKTLAYIDYFYQLIPLVSIAEWIPRWTLDPYILGSNLGNSIFFFFLLFYVFFFFFFFGFFNVIVITVQIQHYCLYSDSTTL